MNLVEQVAALLALSALFAWFNSRWLKLPTTIGLMVLSLLFSLSLILIGVFNPDVRTEAGHIVGQINFSETVLEGMLGFLLFAGAMHVNLGDLKNQRWSIAGLAIVGTLISTGVIAVIAWFIFQLLGIPLNFLWCLLLGTIISPTDPIAVLAILKQSAAPRPIKTIITGESLFNDGVAVVLFMGLAEIASGDHKLEFSHFGSLFLHEVLGGIIFGLVLGILAYQMIRRIDDYPVEILVTLAVASAGYAIAYRLHISGPIVVVIAGLVIGNHGRNFGMSSGSAERLDQFWELVDEFLNAVLFVLIGLELMIVQFTQDVLVVGLLLIPTVLLARLLAVAIPLTLLRWRIDYPKYTIRLLTWGGLRGGVSVALALSLPTLTDTPSSVDNREIILTLTYIVVVFSILVQGLTIGSLVRRVAPRDEANQASSTH